MGEVQDHNGSCHFSLVAKYGPGLCPIIHKTIARYSIIYLIGGSYDINKDTGRWVWVLGVEGKSVEDKSVEDKSVGVLDVAGLISWMNIFCWFM